MMAVMDHEIPLGYCQCGCGQKTRIANQTVRSCGWVRGEPLRYLRGHNARKTSPEYRVDPATGCWISQRWCRPDGYSHLKRNGITVLAHRWYYEDAKGPIPEGLELDHLCRNRACVNPDHLEPVSRHENVRRGERTKLTYGIVDEIRRSADDIHTLARRYAVTSNTIKHIRTRKTWAI